MISFSEFICSFTSTGQPEGKYQVSLTKYTQCDRVNCSKVNMIKKVNKYLVTSSGWCEHAESCNPEETETSILRGIAVCASENAEKVHYSFSLVLWKLTLMQKISLVYRHTNIPSEKTIILFMVPIYLHTHTLKYSILTFKILRYSEYEYPEIHLYCHICAR